MYPVIFMVELLFGAIVGFLLCDNKKGLSIDEIKFSSVMFLLANAFVFWKDKDVPAAIFAHLAISWFILIVGVLIGESIRMRLIRSILRTIQKKDIQVAINEMVQLASYIGYRRRNSDITNLEEKLDEVRAMLDSLSAKGCYENNATFKNNIQYLHELCDSYVELSMTIWQDFSKEEEQGDKLQLWESIGNELKSVSWDTLNHAEEHMVKYLSRIFPFKLVRAAMHK